MDVDETQKIDDLNVADQVKNKNGHDNDQDKKCFLKFLKIITPPSDEVAKQYEYKDVYSLKSGSNTIGRADTCDIIIPSPNLSKMHATIEITSTGMSIWDHKTLNKTKKNNVELKPNIHYDLNENDKITLGNIELLFSFTNTIEGKEAENETNGTHLNIQNTLEDDALINFNLINNKKNADNELVIADTDEEDDSEYQVVNETIQLECSETIPETQQEQDDQITNGHEEKVSDSIAIDETIPVIETAVEEETQIVAKPTLDKIEDIISKDEEKPNSVDEKEEEEVAAAIQDKELTSNETVEKEIVNKELEPELEEKKETTEAIAEEKTSEMIVEEEKVSKEIAKEVTVDASVDEKNKDETDEKKATAVEEDRKLESEVIVESTLLDQTTEKVDDEQNQTKFDADMTVDENTINEMKAGEVKPKRGRKKKIENESEEVESKRPIRSSRRSVVEPVAVPVAKTSARSRKSKKIETPSAEESEEKASESVEQLVSDEKLSEVPKKTESDETKENSIESSKPADEETPKTEDVEKKDETAQETKQEETSDKKEEEEEKMEVDEAPAKVKGKPVRRKNSVLKKAESDSTEKATTPPKRRGRKMTNKVVDETKVEENEQDGEDTAPVVAEETTKENKPKRATKKSAVEKKEEDAEAANKADVYDHSENEEATTTKKGAKGRKSLKSKAVVDEEEKEEEEKPIVEDKKKTRKSVGRKKKEPEVVEKTTESENDEEKAETKSKSSTAATRKEENTTTPQKNANKNLFFQNSRSTTKQLPSMSSSNTISNLDITNVSEITTKEETPRKKIKLNNPSSSDDSDNELSSSAKRMKTNDERIQLEKSTTVTTPKKSPATIKLKTPKSTARPPAKKRTSKKAEAEAAAASTETSAAVKPTNKRKKSVDKSLINLNVSEEMDVTTVTNNEGEMSLHEVSSVSVTKKTPRKIKPIRQQAQLNESTSTRQSSRNTKTGNLVKVLTTGILLSERDQQIITALGGHIAADAKECTHLITNKIIRSCKFLSSVSRGVPILTERWLEESIRARMFLNPTAFKLQDPETEKFYKFSLDRSIEKAKTKPLLKAWKVYIDQTDFEKSDFTLNELKMMVESAQGEIVDKLTDVEADLIDYCMIFVNEETLDKYDGIGASDETLLLRMTVDQLATCLLTQSLAPPV